MKWRVNTYHAMTQFTSLMCNKERLHKTFPEAATKVFCTKDALKDFENFTEMRLKACNFIKKKL